MITAPSTGLASMVEAKPTNRTDWKSLLRQHQDVFRRLWSTGVVMICAICDAIGSRLRASAPLARSKKGLRPCQGLSLAW
jgi:hypothetical protein